MITPKKAVVKKSPVVKKPHVVKKEHVVKSVQPELAVAETKPVAKVAHPPASQAKALRAGSKNFYAVGRRKTAVAQILLSQGDGTMTINQLKFEAYFQTPDLQQVAAQPFLSLGLEKQFNVKAKIHGGGIHAQAEALRHALSRALIIFNPESRRTLKKLGFLTRDPRVKERKKPGLKRARRAPQFSKR